MKLSLYLPAAGLDFSGIVVLAAPDLIRERPF